MLRCPQGQCDRKFRSEEDLKEHKPHMTIPFYAAVTRLTISRMTPMAAHIGRRLANAERV